MNVPSVIARCSLKLEPYLGLLCISASLMLIGRFRQDVRQLAVTPPFFVGFFAVNKWIVSHCCLLPSRHARRRGRSLGAVFVANSRSDIALYRPQAKIKLNIPYSWVFCLTVRSAYWCPANTMVFLISARSVSADAIDWVTNQNTTTSVD